MAPGPGRARSLLYVRARAPEGRPIWRTAALPVRAAWKALRGSRKFSNHWHRYIAGCPKSNP
eukprot:1392727-Alexandrium_andersonii.AAC.1